MPTTNIDQRIKCITGLNDPDEQDLDTMGCSTEDDLRYLLQFVDLPTQVALIKCRKLILIAKYLATGNSLSTTISMQEIQQVLTIPAAPAGATPVPGANPDPNHGSPRVYIDPNPDFSGNAIHYWDWKRKAGATIKQTAYKGFLDNAAVPGNTVEEAHSKELFNIILSSALRGHALNVVEKVRDDNNGLECGYNGWKTLKDWYMDPNQKDLMIQHWESKLTNISLNVDSSATEYIKNFEMYASLPNLVKIETMTRWSENSRLA